MNILERAPLQRWTRRQQQQGAYAVEFALVFPLFIVLVIGIFMFSFVLMSRHLLENFAAETARQCVTRNHDGPDAVEACVAPVGSWLASRMPYVVCWGQPVTFTHNIVNSGVAGTSPRNQDYINLPFLVVTASCQWTFTPGQGVLGSDNPLPMPDQAPLKASAAVPYASYVGPR